VGKTSSAAAFSDGSGCFESVTDVTNIKENFGDLNIRRVPRFLLYTVKRAALDEGLTLKQYVLQVLARASGDSLDDFESDFRE
jgi:hypothetical protein